MTNRERVLSAFKGEPVDRVPVGFWFHFLNNADFDNALSDPALAGTNLAGHRKFIDAFHPDFVKIMSDGYFHYPKPEGVFDTPESLSAIPVIGADHPWIRAQVGLVKEIVAMQEDTAFFHNIFSPLNSLNYIAGHQNVYRMIRENPDAVAKALDAIADGLIVLAEEVIKKGGADGIYLSVTNPDASSLPHDAYRKVVSPSEIRILQAARSFGGHQILHICGYRGQHNDLSVFSEYPADVFNWATHVESIYLAEGRKYFPGKTVLGGFDNVSGSLIHTGTKEEIEAYVGDLLEETGKTGVIIGADCTVPSDIDLTRLEWVRAAAAR